MTPSNQTVRSAPGQSLRVAVDVGGTFTDIVVLDVDRGELRFDKVETTPAAPALGVLDAFAKVGITMADVDYFVHGTTLALNALLTRTGARVAIVTTAGFRDVFELGRTDREPMYDLTYRKPARLVPRRLAFEVPERVNFDGTVRLPLDPVAARAVVGNLRDAGVDAVAVCFLHSYANPDHEAAMGRLVEADLPGVDVTLSHRLLREYREYERTSTAVLDAYIKPVMRSYLQRLEGGLDERGFRGTFLMTRSGGGAMTLAAAKQSPVHLILSGPAGGVIGATAFATLVREPNLITLDMGGTSLDASVIVGGQPTTSTDATFEGLPVSLPALNINTIGAGGGSIAWIDAGGHLQVGPMSAGADPGPASYGKGGQRATVTDAALVAGYLGEATALGGELTLDRRLANDALDPLAQAMGMPVAQVAHGIIRITTTRIVGAVREITVERGHNPRDFAILAFGGGGGLIATDVARELQVPRVIVPPGPGAFSALGMLMADVEHDVSRTRVLELRSADTGGLTDAFRELESEAETALIADGFAADRRELVRAADMRYQGQEHTVTIPIPSGPLDDATVAALDRSFGDAHWTQYGHRMDDPVEIVTLRLRGIGRVPRPQLPEIGRPEDADASRALMASRPVRRPGATEAVAYRVYARALLTPGMDVRGPAILEESTATTVVHDGDRVEVGPHGELIVTIESGGADHG